VPSKLNSVVKVCACADPGATTASTSMIAKASAVFAETPTCIKRRLTICTKHLIATEFSFGGITDPACKARRRSAALLVNDVPHNPM
jgi:hypothetical protein